MPSTREITERVLSGKGVYYHTDDTFYIDESQIGRPIWDDRSERIVGFIGGYLVPMISTIQPNYETIFYVVNQVRNYLTGFGANPSLTLFVDRLDQLLRGSSLLVPDCQGGIDWSLERLSDVTLDYISDIVWRTLARRSGPTAYLKTVVDACSDNDFDGVYLFTLNHDCVLERHLAESGIVCIDGYVKGEFFDRWDPRVFDTRDTVYLLKLHGSIDCFQMNVYSGDERTWVLGRPKFTSINQVIDDQSRIDLASGRPELLVGTENKLHDYLGSHFLYLHSKFYQMLENVDRLLVCGYGFRDTGINTRVYDWLWQRHERKLCIIHDAPDELIANAAGLLPHRLREWRDRGQAVFVSRRIEDTSWAEIKQALV
ncbi:hypothetical protein C3F09_04260 [candidate division GN15 bacterium]|uniref:SIR2-like domain-containing protein n=1 Tax=candidate division GN15 bacterium TaxID=2072418 RepID=A0A855X9E6_9BACT|nr:MAG: hypothetical protein C3F09_04260 [candidate division GN15 bacterium]